MSYTMNEQNQEQSTDEPQMADTVNTNELLADIGSQCRFMEAILKDILRQLERLETAHSSGTVVD
jgi:hypothetical protein